MTTYEARVQGAETWWPARRSVGSWSWWSLVVPDEKGAPGWAAYHDSEIEVRVVK